MMWYLHLIVPFTLQSGDTSLHVVAKNGRTHLVELLLSRGADVNSANKVNTTNYMIISVAMSLSLQVGYTPLHTAARNGHIQVAELLISRGADKNSLDNVSNDVYTYPLQHTHAHAMLFLLQLGYTPLHIAVVKGHKQIAELLLSRGVDVNSVTKVSTYI